MAMIQFRDCLASELSTLSNVPGSLIVCRDSGDMAYDTLDGQRVILGKTVNKVEGALSDEMFPQEGHFYYSETDKIVAVYHGSKMEPVNVSLMQYMRSSIAVAKSDYSTVSISDDGTFKAGNTVMGTIIGAYAMDPVILPSIADQASEFTGKITLTVAKNKENDGYTATIKNDHTDLSWIGNIGVMLLVIPSYDAVTAS